MTSAEQCFTPTSTLTSQGSTNYSSQRVAIPASPVNSQRAAYVEHFASGGSNSVYGNLGDDLSETGDLVDGDLTLRVRQQNVHRTGIAAASSSAGRNQQKLCDTGLHQNDSAVYNVASSDSARPGARSSRTVDPSEYATSVV